jgi:hypothetical protein
MRRPVSGVYGGVFVALLLASGAATQCSSFQASPGGAADASAGSDAAAEAATQPPEDATADAAADAGTADGGSDSGIVNLLSNGDFEIGECADWNPYGTGVTVASSTEAHSGTKSCVVCFSELGDNSMMQNVPVLLPAGAQLNGSIWVKLPSDGGGVTGTHAQANLYAFPPGAPAQMTVSIYSSLLTTWRQVEMGVLVVEDGGTTSAEVRVYGDGTVAGMCLLVDDIQLYRAQ